MSKYVATAMITDPAAVITKCASCGWIYDKGAIFVSIPEIGLEGMNLVYCRYGLSFPYIRVQTGWKLLVEPTIDDDKRWFYTGLVDCAGITPVTSDQLLIQLLTQVIYATTAGTMHLSKKTATESFVLGVKLQTWITNTLKAIFDAHVHLDPVSGSTGAPTIPLTAPTDILSTKIFGE